LLLPIQNIISRWEREYRYQEEILAMPKDHGTITILQAMPEQSNYQLELP
jgi:hypothetical protein